MEPRSGPSNCYTSPNKLITIFSQKYLQLSPTLSTVCRLTLDVTSATNHSCLETPKYIPKIAENHCSILVVIWTFKLT